jgi:hypothetical protein
MNMSSSKNKLNFICAKNKQIWFFMSYFDVLYDYKSLEKLIPNHLIFGLSI